MLSLADLRGYQPLSDAPTFHVPPWNESNVPPWLDIRRSYPPSFPTPHPGAAWEPDSTDPSQASASSTATYPWAQSATFSPLAPSNGSSPQPPSGGFLGGLPFIRGTDENRSASGGILQYLGEPNGYLWQQPKAPGSGLVEFFPTSPYGDSESTFDRTIGPDRLGGGDSANDAGIVSDANPDAWIPDAQYANFRASRGSSQAGGAVVPVSYQESARARPWWYPPDVFDPWADSFNKGTQGLINFLRSGRGFGGGGGRRRRDDDECYSRWASEEARCYNRKPMWWGGCKERAAERRNLCIQYQGDPPYEPPEWSKADEERSFFPDR